MRMRPIPILAPDKPLLSAEEVGKVFEVTDRTIDRWVERGRFPQPVIVNGRRRWPNTVVAAWVVVLPFLPETPPSPVTQPSQAEVRAAEDDDEGEDTTLAARERTRKGQK